MSAAQRIVLGSLLALLACGDDDAATDPALFREDFESDCAGAVCGWEQIAGDAGAARRVSTILPGEHALQLEGERVVVRGPMPEPSAGGFTTTTTQLEARISVRCDAGATLDLRVAVLDEAVPPTGRLDSHDVRVPAPPTWEDARLVVRPLPASARDGGFGTPPVRVVGVTLVKDGPGICEVGDLRIDAAFAFVPVPSPGC